MLSRTDGKIQEVRKLAEHLKKLNGNNKNHNLSSNKKTIQAPLQQLGRKLVFNPKVPLLLQFHLRHLQPSLV